ncbi:MAG: GIY-YIG nuclease family protein [Candidatus Uhrbacteria bacterium]|nr:GIY-YIG nuclease family protein [Candidatus Uhrbacteria bacterium]
MFTVYALRSERDGRIYVGFSEHLERRLKEHNAGQVTSTKAYLPWSILYTLEVETRLEARQQEKKFKSGFGKEFLKSKVHIPR